MSQSVSRPRIDFMLKDIKLRLLSEKKKEKKCLVAVRGNSGSGEKSLSK